MTDGTTAQDFEALTIEKMQKYLNTDSNDFHKLFDLVIARIQDEIEGKPLKVEEPIKKAGRPKKNDTKAQK